MRPTSSRSRDGQPEQTKKKVTFVELPVFDALGRVVPVEPLVIVHGASVSGWLSRRPRGVKVLPSRAATWWLRMTALGSGRPGKADIEALYAAARDPATWRRT